jgi:hypothetical protein
MVTFNREPIDSEDSDKGCEMMESVMQFRHDIASAAVVRRLRDSGKVSADHAASLAGKLAFMVEARCREKEDTVISDCARFFAGTGKSQNAMIMAFVCYSMIGVEIADEVIAGL